MTFRVATTAVLAALFLSTGAQAAPRGDDEPRPGRGFGPPPREGGEHGPGRARPQLFISPAGEPFRAPAEGPYPVAAWFSAADANHDGALSRDEFVADAGRFFILLDTDKDGVIDGFEVSAYERNIAPEILQGINMAPAGDEADVAALPAAAMVRPASAAGWSAAPCRGPRLTRCSPSPSP